MAGVDDCRLRLFTFEFGMKILVPVIHRSASSDAAYRIGDIADSFNAELLVLFVVPKFSSQSYLRGEITIGIFEEAVQDYDVAVRGSVVVGSPALLVAKIAKAEQVDLVMLGATSEEEEDWQLFLEKLRDANVICEVRLLEEDPIPHVC